MSNEQMEELLAPTYRVGVYCRLSKEDDDIREGESQSISHQREIIEGFCKKKGWRIEDVTEIIIRHRRKENKCRSHLGLYSE